MSLRITLAGSTGWVGKASCAASPPRAICGGRGQPQRGRAGCGRGGRSPRLGVQVSATLEEALKAPSDVVIDYTKPGPSRRMPLRPGASPPRDRRTSGLSAEDYAEIDRQALKAERGVLAAGTFRSRRAAAPVRPGGGPLVSDVEVIDYASAKPDTPSGTARELAELLSEVRQSATSKPPHELVGVQETRGGAQGPGSRGSIPCACRPSCSPARRCSGPTTSGS